MIEITTTRDEYEGDALDTTFPFTFRIDSKAHLAVYVDGVLQTVDTDYEVSGVGDADGGTVTFEEAPADGVNVILQRVSPQTQLLQLPAEGPFDTQELEINALDKLLMMIQELKEELARCLKFPITSLFRDVTVSDPEAGQILRWNGDEDMVESALAATLEITHTVITQAVLAGASTITITHNLGSASAKLIGFSPTWFTGFIIASQTINTIVVQLNTECPVGGGTLVSEVAL